MKSINDVINESNHLPPTKDTIERLIDEVKMSNCATEDEAEKVWISIFELINKRLSYPAKPAVIKGGLLAAAKKFCE